MEQKQIKRGEDGIRLCDQKGCEFPATHTFIWAQQGWQCQCLIHTQKMIGLEAHLGYNIAANSVRQMTPDEMMPDDPDDTEEFEVMSDLDDDPDEPQYDLIDF